MTYSRRQQDDERRFPCAALSRDPVIKVLLYLILRLGRIVAYGRHILQMLNPAERGEAERYGSRRWPAYFVQILDLVDSMHGNESHGKSWTPVANISSRDGLSNASQLGHKMRAHEDRRGSSRARQRFRVVTSTSPPFVQASTRMLNGTCLTGVTCLRVSCAVCDSMSSLPSK